MTNESSVASQLRQAREEKGQTLEEAHKGSGVSLNGLVDLESGTCDAVEPVYARFALRSYALYLGLEVEPLEKLFDAQFGFRPRQYQVQQSATYMPLDKPSWTVPLPRLALVLIIVIVLGTACIIYWKNRSSVGQTDQTNQAIGLLESKTKFQSKLDTMASLAVGQP
jgi:cytoskeletal protein RodZ